MKYLKEYNSHHINTVAICYKYCIIHYTKNDDGSIDAPNINLNGIGLDQLPLKFRIVSGFFACSNNKLTSLEGSPRTVDGFFTCYDNQLTSLEGAPKTIGGTFYCYGNQIRDLYGMPKVQGDIQIYDNPVYSIIHHFITREDKNEWVELFNELDIIQDDGYTIILDRLKYFYEGTKLNRDVNRDMLDEIKKQGYKII